MAEDWRDHLTDEGDGTMRIKAHGNMKVDARLVTNAQHLQTMLMIGGQNSS